jgi:hypothetical protein
VSVFIGVVRSSRLSVVELERQKGHRSGQKRNSFAFDRSIAEPAPHRTNIEPCRFPAWRRRSETSAPVFPGLFRRFGAIETAGIATATSDKLLRRPVAGLGVELIEPVCP